MIKTQQRFGTAVLEILSKDAFWSRESWNYCPNSARVPKKHVLALEDLDVCFRVGALGSMNDVLPTHGAGPLCFSEFTCLATKPTGGQLSLATDIKRWAVAVQDLPMFLSGRAGLPRLSFLI